MKNFNPCIAWHYIIEYENMKRNLNNFPHVYIETIPREDSDIAYALVDFGRNDTQLSLFFEGLDCPFWLEDLCSRRNLFF